MDTHDRLLFHPHTSHSYLIQKVTILLSPSSLKFEISQPRKNSRLELGKHHTQSYFQETPQITLHTASLLIKPPFPAIRADLPADNAWHHLGFGSSQYFLRDLCTQLQYPVKFRSYKKGLVLLLHGTKARKLLIWSRFKLGALKHQVYLYQVKNTFNLTAHTSATRTLKSTATACGASVRILIYC